LYTEAFSRIQGVDLPAEQVYYCMKHALRVLKPDSAKKREHISACKTAPPSPVTTTKASSCSSAPSTSTVVAEDDVSDVVDTLVDEREEGDEDEDYEDDVSELSEEYADEEDLPSPKRAKTDEREVIVID
jgi:hypothetical protein